MQLGPREQPSPSPCKPPHRVPSPQLLGGRHSPQKISPLAQLPSFKSWTLAAGRDEPGAVLALPCLGKQWCISRGQDFVSRS